MKSMNHLNKVLLVSLIVLPFTSSESLAVWGWGSKKANSKPSLVSRVYDNRVVSAVATQAGQHPVVTSCAKYGGCALGSVLIAAVSKKLYDRLPNVSSKAKTCGSYLSSGAKACGSWIKNHKLASVGTAGSAGLLALDFWKKPMGGNPISATIARSLLSWLNSHRRPVVIGTAVTGLGGLGLWGSRLIAKHQSGASLVANSTEEVAKNPVTPGATKPAAAQQNNQSDTKKSDNANQQVSDKKTAQSVAAAAATSSGMIFKAGRWHENGCICNLCNNTTKRNTTCNHYGCRR